MEHIKIDNSDIFLDDLGNGRGKITVSNTYGYNYSMYWGAMGSTLKDFLSQINGDYFTGKLLPSNQQSVFDSKSTFAALRKHIREELELPFHKHMEFQKDMREMMKEFEQSVNSSDDFVREFTPMFIDRLDFYLIEDKTDRDAVTFDFKNIDECWYFIHEMNSPEYHWLMKLHMQLKKNLN